MDEFIISLEVWSLLRVGTLRFYMCISTFLSLREWVREGTPTDQYKIVIHADKRPWSEYLRRYNGPSCSEVAALIRGNEDGMIGKRDIVVRKRGSLNNGNEVLHKVRVTHRSYDPLSYVVLFQTAEMDGILT